MHSSCFPWFVPFGLYQISSLGARPRLSAVGKNYPIRSHLLLLYRTFFTKKGRRVGAGRRVTINTFHYIARQYERARERERERERERVRRGIGGGGRVEKGRRRQGWPTMDGDECMRRASLHLRSLPNGVESFHAEGTSSSFTDRGPSTFPFTHSLRWEKFSRCQVKLTFFVSTMENFITWFPIVSSSAIHGMPFYAFIRALFRSLSYVERQKMTPVKSTPRKRFYHVRDRFLRS